jgi:RNA polymerase sigma-70 factor (ECF subfamily)
MQQLTDEELVEHVVNRNPAAFASLVDRHRLRVISLARAVTQDPVEARDIAQEMFLKLWERPQLFDSTKARFTTWLHRVTVNLSIDRKRAQRFVPLDDVTDPFDSAPSLIERLHIADLRAAVHRACFTLPNRQRQALALFYLEELPQKEAAAEMQMSEGAFESLLQRARKSLRDAWIRGGRARRSRVSRAARAS